MANKLGEKIKTYRVKNKLTLEQLAALANLSKSYLWELENRESQSPSAEKLQAIADALQLDVSFFVDDNVDSPETSHRDKEFFRSYSKLGGPEKEKLRLILDVLKKS